MTARRVPVAPLAGAWIEISDTQTLGTLTLVAPLAGAWIEIEDEWTYVFKEYTVAPLAGAWIEILAI